MILTLRTHFILVTNRTAEKSVALVRADKLVLGIAVGYSDT